MVRWGRHRIVPSMRWIHVLPIALVLVGCSSGVLSLDVGTCFDDPESFSAVTEVPVIDCSEPHDNEVIATFDVPGDAYPGDDSVTEQSEVGCVARFEPYVGIDYDSSIYEVGWLNPTEDSWATGDREVICFAYDVTLAKITGSIEGVAE